MSIQIIRPAHVFEFTCDTCGKKSREVAENERDARSQISCEYPCWEINGDVVMCQQCQDKRDRRAKKLATYQKLKAEFEP